MAETLQAVVTSLEAIISVIDEFKQIQNAITEFLKAKSNLNVVSPLFCLSPLQPPGYWIRILR